MNGVKYSKKVFKAVSLKFSYSFKEMHKTETKYENYLIFKMFILFFVNYYLQAFYISFGKGRLVVIIL